ncbi:trichohyalin-like [Paramacrobiotus metropolitanus]|uniref:trichohyalin-like n=1 Tax=Paramacrobiotus metropolitanus TaxID=2943436 RepID=UPI0024463BBC|nr:trichohyalin-like [Paramacrobiotus metropolitanus]
MTKVLKQTGAGKQETYRILTRDHCRDLRIPRKNHSPVREISENEWRKIRYLANSTELKQKLEDDKNRKEERYQMESDYLRRKAEFDQIEAEQNYDPMEEEIRREKSEKVQELGNQLVTEKLENDDTVRFFNDCLNGALVRAVRDRQVLKKEQIKQLAEQEEFRIDNACQKDANLGFAIGQKIEEFRHSENSRYGQLLKDQLKSREEERGMEKEAAAVEGRRALEFARRMQRKEVEDGIREYNNKRQITKRLLQQNANVLDKKKEAKLHQARMDMAIAQAWKEKNAELDRREEEARAARKKKEEELAFALSQQKRSVDQRAIEDEKRAQRAVYQADREWRKKELSKALKHARELEEMKRIIQYQKEQKIRKDAHELEEERRIFDQTQQQLVSEAQKAEEKRLEREEKRRQNAEELRRQIEEREKDRWQYIQEKWDTGSNIRQEMKGHEEKVAAYMKDKMDKAEAAGVPHAYMLDIVRHMTNEGYLPKPEKPHQKLKNIDHITKLVRHFE